MGEWFPGLAASEVLHMGYNSLQLTGLILLLPGFKGRARRWWTLALVFQSWHFLEHVLLQVQFLTGYYLFNDVKQTSLLEVFLPAARVALHLQPARLYPNRRRQFALLLDPLDKP